MRLISWNIRAGGGRRIAGIAAQLQHWQADLVALQEFRGTAPSQQLAQDLADLGLSCQLSTVDPASPATNALLLASRYPLRATRAAAAPDNRPRWLLARIACERSFIIGVMHVPNAVRGRKAPFHDAVLHLAQRWRRGPALFVGDTNTGISGLDDVTHVFSAREEAWMHGLQAAGWRDVFRDWHGDKRVYTWYSPNAGNGFRLDQAFVNARLMDQVSGIHYAWGIDDHAPTRRDALSDHAALILDLQMDGKAGQHTRGKG
ncbi:endonuclease/exonuclease/phosphatase family protein [Candidatus Entotheonella palauensis]|uniref:endonuclease/exonuclease/phosphatase family protein n=1 Tax=Candidatus Entotheonella palauensis TaxID=93172 RepID=UPI0015C449F1|nr:endonuclease/exonuclease/phosphatase family protein [Candidatus Entotheonella palauensis]